MLTDYEEVIIADHWFKLLVNRISNLMLKTIVEFSLMLSLISLMLGCGPSAPVVPKINAAASASAAMDEYDTNKDGFIDQAELKSAPSLKDAEKVIDSNSDGKLSRDEIEQRLNKYSTQGMALMSFSCSVTMNGAKKAGIEVEMVPEKFMLGSIKMGKGKTDANGMVNGCSKIARSARPARWPFCTGITRTNHHPWFYSAPCNQCTVAMLPMIAPCFIINLWRTAKLPNCNH